MKVGGIRNLMKGPPKIMDTRTPVVVLQLPQKLVLGHADTFFQEAQEFLRTDRPRLVFDFSEVTQVDSAGVEVLLNCMEEAMKRNGDLKLAAIPPGPAVVLELTQVDHLFEIFENTSDAAQSFQQFPIPAFGETQQSWGQESSQGIESATS